MIEGRGVGLVLSLLVVGCVGSDADKTVVASCPDGAAFAMVSPVLEASCGSLDCHGAPGRPLRVYGQNGWRLLEGDISGGAPTRPEEREATLRSLCGLEPALIREVVEGREGAEQLLVVKKPRAEERHKGGQVFEVGEAGDLCLVSWLSGEVDESACAMATPAQ